MQALVETFTLICNLGHTRFFSVSEHEGGLQLSAALSCLQQNRQTAGLVYSATIVCKGVGTVLGARVVL